MKYVLLLLVFAACQQQSQYHPIIYTSEQACADEQIKMVDSIAKLSAVIDTLIARRDRLPPEKRKVYDYAVKRLGEKINDTTLSKYFLEYQGRKMGFDPKKVQDGSQPNIER